MLAPREAALVGAHSFVERAEGLADDDVVLVAVEDSRNGGCLRFGNRGDFLNHHALSFTLRPGTAGGQSNHPQRHDAVSVEAKLRNSKCYIEPGVEQVTPFAGEKRRPTSRRTLVRRTIWATLFCSLADYFSHVKPC